jgi:hypothetical protein
MTKQVCEMLSCNKGQISSKRVMSFLSFVWISIAFLANVFVAIPLEEHIFDGMLYLVMAGMGFTSFEKFSPSTKQRSSSPPDDFLKDLE